MPRNAWKWLDRIDSIEPGIRAQGHKQFASDDPIFKMHFPQNPIVPGVLLVEMAAQVAGECLRAANPGRMVLLSKIKSAKFFVSLRPNENATVYVEIIGAKMGCADIRGRIEVEGSVRAEIQFQMVSVMDNKSVLNWSNLESK